MIRTSSPPTGRLPHFTDRIGQAQGLVADHDRTPALADADRELLGDTLRTLRRVTGERGGEQLLHGEPHPGNVLRTCCPGADQDLLRQCRILVLAMVTTWRWDRDDQVPDGRRLGTEWLGRIRAALDRDGPGG